MEMKPSFKGFKCNILGQDKMVNNGFGYNYLTNTDNFSLLTTVDGDKTTNV